MNGNETIFTKHVSTIAASTITRPPRVFTDRALVFFHFTKNNGVRTVPGMGFVVALETSVHICVVIIYAAHVTATLPSEVEIACLANN